MKKIYTTLILIFFLNLLYAQNPLVKQWDKRFGGTLDDAFECFRQTTDAGYILAGTSLSDSSGDKTQNCWHTSFNSPTFDYWIVKIDSLGIKQWDKDFGGNNHDYLYFLNQTADGGYLLGGSSTSGISGDKTQPLWSVGYLDYWIVKIDSLGIKQWDKDFGGDQDDWLFSSQQTNDKGYILGGHTYSGISGDKTQASWGVDDYWIVKIDSLGIKQWDKDFGGTGQDRLHSIQQTLDRGYILGGFSTSGISGDKTQDNWDTIAPITFDYWVVKTDSLGNKQWDKNFGGDQDDWLYSIQQTSDGGYILGGFSGSGISGDKTQATWGSWDYWIVKIDSLGNKQWDKDIGGLDGDELYNLIQTKDGGYLLSGDSYSNIGGDKSENNLGIEQTWIVKTDSLGNKQWDKTLLTNSTFDDELGKSIQTEDGCYSIANMTDAGIGGDKTQSSWGYYDYWIIKFCDTTSTTGTINTLNFNYRISVYPSPFTSGISITFQKQNIKQLTISIKNILGQTVFSQQENYLINTYIKSVDLNLLSNGIYLLDVNIDGEQTFKKIVKE